MKWYMHLKYDIELVVFRIKRICQLIKIACKDNDWDYAYTLDVEYKKLEWMRDYLREVNRLESDLHDAEWIDKALHMLDIIRGRDEATELIHTEGYDDNDIYDFGHNKFILTKYVNIKNVDRFLPKGDGHENHIYDEDDNTCAIWRNSLRMEKAWYLYHEIRKNFMRGWWD